jgi:hypothetical protein
VEPRRVVRRITRQDRRGLAYIIGVAVVLHIVAIYFMFRPIEEVMPKTDVSPEVIAAEEWREKYHNFQPATITYTDEAGEVSVEKGFSIDIGKQLPPMKPQAATPPETPPAAPP